MPRKPQEEAPGAPAWMMTFSDITTLLLTFFILIMTFSTIEKERFEKAKGSFRGALGVLSDEQERSRTAIMSRYGTLNDRTRDEGADLPRRQVPEEVADRLLELPEGDRIQLDRSDVQWRIRLPSVIAFAPGSDRLTAEAERLYRGLAAILRDYPNALVLEGHTDGRFFPDRGFRTDWELAGARAASVADILREEGVPDDQVSLRSHGSTRPAAPNDTALNLARNRRVDVLVLGAKESGVDR